MIKYNYADKVHIRLTVGPNSPMVSALECECSAFNPHILWVNKGALSGPTACFDPVGVVDCLNHECQDLVSVGSKLNNRYTYNNGYTYINSCHQWDMRQLSKLSLSICTFKELPE